MLSSQIPRFFQILSQDFTFLPPSSRSLLNLIPCFPFSYPHPVFALAGNLIFLACFHWFSLCSTKSNPMASTSTTSAPTESEPANTCERGAPSSSSSPSSSGSVFSCCLDWVSSFVSRRSMESNSMASTSATTGCIPENEGIMGAFHEISPYSCTPSTLIQKKPSFDVFINHRGPGVKKTIASRIYDILESMKVTAFLDSEELEYGDFLPTTIEAAIRGATLHIAIFSERYAESSWCLEELSLMLKSGAKIVPIFYKVEPSDLRYVAQGKGKYVAAFSKHEKKCRYRPEKLQEWKKALSDVSLYSGQIIKNNEDEMRLFKNLVNIVLKEIGNMPLIVAKHPVGLEETAKDFENTLQLVPHDQGVEIVGIWGMGGSGKTTLAKELYNRRSSSAERSCFIFDIREAKGVLQNKQIQLLKGFGVNDQVDNIEQGKAILARHLRSFRVCIVMDDVDDVAQLDALVPVKDSLVRGSLIIVTTREYEVLTSWGIYSIYKMKALDPFNAEQLFCWHAFLHPSPLHGFEKLVKKFVEACQGLPLSLKVFGGQLYGRSNKQYWESLFHKISRILHKNIREKLKVSYDALDDEEKEAFLDTACFFIGEEKSLAIEVWDGSGWSGIYTWERLLNKCLIEVDNNNRIRMHDHLRDLGREVANQHSTSRIWLSQQIIDSSKQTEKTNSIQGIKVAPTGREERLSYAECLSGGILFLRTSLVGLKLLVIEGNYFNEIIDEASRELLWLRWDNIGQRILSSQLSLKNLKVLQLSESHGQNLLEELWEADSDAPVELRELVISECWRFRRLPNSIGCLNELKKIVIKGSEHIYSLPDEFCRLKLLQHLELYNCRMLSSLPSRFGDLTNLQYLDLSKCSNLRRLPVSFKNLILLKYLNFTWCEKFMLRSEDFQNITKLEYLSLSACTQLEELPENITNQASLRSLNLYGVKRLKELLIKIDQLSRLQEIWIGSELLISLPNSLGNLSSLTNLSIQDCPNLESLPTSLGNLWSLTDLTIENCPNLESLPTSLGNLSSLADLSIRYCPNLESLPTSLGKLCSLRNLTIGQCPKLKHLYICECPISQVDFGAAYLSFALSNLIRLELVQTAVCRVSFSEDRYPRLQWLSLSENNHLTEITALPVNLEFLSIYRCPKLEELPSFTRLASLREFRVHNCDRIEKIEGLQHCTRLERLSLLCSESERLEVRGIESLENLRRVEVRAKKGSVIQSCIQRMQKWPDETIIWMRAVPEAWSLVDSFELGLSGNLSVADSFSKHSSNDILAESKLVVQNHFSSGNAIMLCFLINVAENLYPLLVRRVDTGSYDYVSWMHLGQGRWAVIYVLTQRSRWLTGNDEFLFDCLQREVERGLAVRGEEQTLVMEALLPLLQSISS